MLQRIAIIFFNLFAGIYGWIILARVIISWTGTNAYNSKIGNILFELTEPILAPVRKLLPFSKTVDLSPLVVFILLQLLSNWINGLIKI